MISKRAPPASLSVTVTAQPCAVEDAVAVGCGNPWPGVGDEEPVREVADGHPDGRTTVFDGVRQEVRQQPSETTPVGREVSLGPDVECRIARLEM